ncbi:MAG: metallophosphoesterase [Candidatus Marinimicrobia bacterium]|nr:metallophosphoesterase [Candidatus Neomarinimicrobiota bacterium]
MRQRYLPLWISLWVGLGSLLAQTPSGPPENFTIAFLGDQGLGANAEAVLRLVKSEGAEVVLHQGDFDYEDDPLAWMAQIDAVLGPEFPYFAMVGNHDEPKWSGVEGYQQLLEGRARSQGVAWEGEYGVQSSFTYQGVFIIFTAPGVMGQGHDRYIKEQLAANQAIWSICAWHKNMRRMQLGRKSDETGWGVYEEARNGGAIIATGHEHSYSRTHLLSNFTNQTVASTSDTVVLTKGKTFAFVSGIGGKNLRRQIQPSDDWWASIYTTAQGAQYGALFGVFNVDGQANLAHFYFKNIDGVVIDSFVVISHVETSRQ